MAETEENLFIVSNEINFDELSFKRALLLSILQFYN